MTSGSAGVSAPSEAVAPTASDAPGPVAEPEAEPAASTSAPAPAPHPSRRLFVSRVVGGAAAAAGLATVGYGAYGVLRGPSVRRITVPLAKLPRAAHGFRIAVVSDIHIGPILGRAHARRIVDTINATSPDLVAVVGDLVDRVRRGPRLRRRTAGRPPRPARQLLRHRQPRVLLRGRAVGRSRPRTRSGPAGERPGRDRGLRPRRGQRHRGRDRGAGPRLRLRAGRPGPGPRRRPDGAPAGRHPRRRRARRRPAALRPHPRRAALARQPPRRAGQPHRRRPRTLRRHPALRLARRGRRGPPVGWAPRPTSPSWSWPPVRRSRVADATVRNAPDRHHEIHTEGSPSATETRR